MSTTSLATRYTIPYFLGKAPNALDLKEACQFVDSISFMLTGNHMKLIHCDALKLITLLTKAREYNKLHGRMVYSFILSHQAHPYAQVGEC